MAENTEKVEVQEVEAKEEKPKTTRRKKTEPKKEEKPMNIYQKMLEVKKVVGYLQKAANGPQYQYVSSGQVLSAVTEKMNEVGLFLEVEVKNHTVERREKPTKSGTNIEYFTELDLVYTWVNVDNPDEKISKGWYGQGIDTAGEKGVGKALTYAEKYFMLKWFNIATDKDDPDAFQEKIERSKPQLKLSSHHLDVIHSKLDRLLQFGGTEHQVLTKLQQSVGYTGELPSVTVDFYESIVAKLDAWIKVKETSATKKDPENFRETMEEQENNLPVEKGNFEQVMEWLLKFGGTEAAVRAALATKHRDIQLDKDFDPKALSQEHYTAVMQTMMAWLADKEKNAGK